jgi:hypothetical protein
MTEVHDKVTRFASDLVDSAAAEGARQSRSARQQLDHWVRIGRAVSASTGAARQRIEAALAGTLPMAALSSEEGAVFNGEIAAALEEHLADTHYGKVLAAEAITTVALDDSGRLIQYAPDGSSTVLTTP